MQVRPRPRQHPANLLVISAGVVLSLTSRPIQIYAQATASTGAPLAPVSSTQTPIAIVPLDSRMPGSAASVTGALQVAGGRALITANGTVVSGTTTTEVSLPNRGTLRVCASTEIKLAADSAVPAGESPGLMMAMDHGAVEASFATGRNADILLTPDFRILIGGPGSANVKVRLAQEGDTCVDNPGSNAPYVLVTSVFDGSIYRVQPGQRVMFQHGSLREVVDQEKESCGCPPAPSETKGNDFPLAQSEGLAPTPPENPTPAPKSVKPAEPTVPLVYNADKAAPPATPQPATAATTSVAAATPPQTETAQKKKPNFFTRVGHFFRRIFGAE
jgi:hypothetical protein